MKKWYCKGLKFSCTGCGKCCQGTPGYVWLSLNDIERISKFLNISKKEFLIKYTRQVFNRLSLLEVKDNFKCIFLIDNKCQIYTVRPIQCKTFPFWPENVQSKENWKKISCEGIDNVNAKTISQDEIDKQLKFYSSEER